MIGRRLIGERLKAAFQKLAGVFGARNKYQPELHYMRGPGPKSQVRLRQNRDKLATSQNSD